MADRVPKETRSKIMSNIKSRNTGPEMLLRKALFRKGYRYSISHRTVPGNIGPDITMVSRKVAIFVDGCFWHMCPKCFKMPESNRGYWKPKLMRNAERDGEQNDILKSLGWNVIRVWEHEVMDDAEGAAIKISRQLIKIRN